MNGYKTYRFKDKDPVIDELRTIIHGTASLSGKSRWRTYSDLAERTGMTATTLWSWFEGNTRRPQHASVKAVVRALGHELRMVKASNVVPFKKRAA